jgi:class 3 adenylate cyclase
MPGCRMQSGGWIGVAELPSGLVTFLFTDVVGSTRLSEEHPEAWRVASLRHDEIVRDAIASHRGQVVKTATSDGPDVRRWFHAVFTSVEEALGAAADAQVALHAEPWELPDGLRVRMGLHTCQVEMRDGDYHGTEVHRAARLTSVAHDGQVVVSAATAELAREAAFELRDLGEHRLRGLARPERVSQLCPAGLEVEFEPDRVLATVLFTDLVSSTAQLTDMGDRGWRHLITAHDALVRAELDRFRGEEVRFDGDGVVATFDRPGRAIRCACAIRDALGALGLDVRAGIHTGEIEQRGDEIEGIAVVIGKRVSSAAGPGQVLVSRTVADLIAGSGVELHDEGEHELKGVSGTWRLYSVV